MSRAMIDFCGNIAEGCCMFNVCHIHGNERYLRNVKHRTHAAIRVIHISIADF